MCLLLGSRSLTAQRNHHRARTLHTVVTRMQARQSSAIMQRQVTLLLSGDVIDSAIQFCSKRCASPETATIQTASHGYTPFYTRKMRHRKRSKGQRHSKSSINDNNTFARRGDNIKRRYRPHISARIIHPTLCLNHSSPKCVSSWVVNRSMPSAFSTAGSGTCWWWGWGGWWWWTFRDIVIVIVMKILRPSGFLVTAITVATDVV